MFIYMRKILFLSVILLSTIVFAGQVYAGLVPCGLSQDDPNMPGNQTVRCQLCHFFTMAERIVDFILFTVVPPLAILLVVVAGSFFIFSGYDPSLIAKARAMLSSIGIGLLILYGSWMLVGFFFGLIGLANTDLGNSIRNWFTFPCP